MAAERCRGLASTPRCGSNGTFVRNRLVLGVSMLWPAVVACSPVHSRLRPPYLLDGRSYSETELGARAVQRCLSGGRVAAELPPVPFTTDGCTGASDAGITECCIEHDTAYWCGGAARLRVVADARLRRCVDARRGPLVAGVVYAAVRVGGSGWLPFPWRWGYGYPWLRARPTSVQVPGGGEGSSGSQAPRR